jgi:hypothetical protein
MDSNEISTGVVVATPAPAMWEHVPATTTGHSKGGVRPLTGARRGSTGYAPSSLPSSGTPILAPPV